jgi:hypothetical protein
VGLDCTARSVKPSFRLASPNYLALHSVEDGLRILHLAAPQMDPASRPANLSSSINGAPIIAVPAATGPPTQKSPPPETLRSKQQDEKRHSLQTATQKRNDVVTVPKKSGFGLFGKFKEEDDDRDQLKRLKAENKVLRAQFRDLEIKSSQIGAENERFKNSLIGERKINNQLHPDSFYSSALDRLSVGITDWTVTHFRGKNSKEYTVEMVEEIRAGLRKLSDANNLIPQTLHWTDVDLQRALADSKFRIAFVLHVISLHLHEKIFSPFSYEIEDFGLGYWLKRISDEVARSGSSLPYVCDSTLQQRLMPTSNGTGVKPSSKLFRRCLMVRQSSHA